MFISNPGDQDIIKKLQSQIKDLETNLVLNKDILSRLLSSSPEDVNTQLMTVIRELQTKNSTLEKQVAGLVNEKEQLQTFASQ
jgi:hypothetical protein